MSKRFFKISDLYVSGIIEEMKDILEYLKKGKCDYDHYGDNLDVSNQLILLSNELKNIYCGRTSIDVRTEINE
jgi:hypothetical protein